LVEKSSSNNTFHHTGPSCSETHVPGYINSDKAKSFGKIFVVSVNDAFVMKAWGKDLDAGSKSGVRISSLQAVYHNLRLQDEPLQAPGRVFHLTEKKVSNAIIP